VIGNVIRAAKIATGGVAEGFGADDGTEGAAIAKRDAASRWRKH
jgi:hypothetical protein